MKIISVCTAKGGVGKTTAVIQISACLAKFGKSVICIDVDSQGNLSDQFGVSSEKNLAIFLRAPDKGVDVLTVRENIDFIPSGKSELYNTMKFIIMDSSPVMVLSDALDFLHKEKYDYCLIDTSPTLTLMNDNAIVFSDSVLIPFSIGYFDISGANQLIENVEKFNKRERKNAPIKIEGVFINFFDERTKLSKSFEEMLKKKFDNKLLKTKIHKSILIAEAPIQKKTIFEYAPNSRASQEWESLTMELMNNAKNV